MNIKNIVNTVSIFIIKRLIEICGIFVSILGILLLLSLITYSPNDPNFIFPENTKIENLLGYQGSYVSDLFFQSLGLSAFLIPFTYLFTGLNIFKSKNIFLLLENTFFLILCLLAGSLFFNLFYLDNFALYINGNGGFVGKYFSKMFSENLISAYKHTFYYFLLFLIFFLFLKSINFKIKNFITSIKTIYKFLFNKNEKNYTNKNEVINEYIPQDEIKNLIQEDLPFIKADEKQSSNKIKFKLPLINLLKEPNNKERNSSDKNENSDPKFLEKIL